MTHNPAVLCDRHVELLPCLGRGDCEPERRRANVIVRGNDVRLHHLDEDVLLQHHIEVGPHGRDQGKVHCTPLVVLVLGLRVVCVCCVCVYVCVCVVCVYVKMCCACCVCVCVCVCL